MTPPAAHGGRTADDAQLAALGYAGEFERSMGLWANMALGFTYLSPLVGVYSLFAYSLSIGGPPAIWWIVIVGVGQLLVSLVFGEVVSQYPLAGGIYPWTRRLWNRRYAWIVSWVYIWAIIVTVTSVAEFGGGFVAALFGIEATPGVALATAVALLVLAFVINYSGTRTLARIAKIGLAAELIGVIALGPTNLVRIGKRSPWRCGPSVPTPISSWSTRVIWKPKSHSGVRMSPSAAS